MEVSKLSKITFTLKNIKVTPFMGWAEGYDQVFSPVYTFFWDFVDIYVLWLILFRNATVYIEVSTLHILLSNQ